MSGINHNDFCSHEALFLLSRVAFFAFFCVVDVLGLLHELNVVDLGILGRLLGMPGLY